MTTTKIKQRAMPCAACVVADWRQLADGPSDRQGRLHWRWPHLSSRATPTTDTSGGIVAASGSSTTKCSPPRLLQGPPCRGVCETRLRYCSSRLTNWLAQADACPDAHTCRHGIRQLTAQPGGNFAAGPRPASRRPTAWTLDFGLRLRFWCFGFLPPELPVDVKLPQSVSCSSQATAGGIAKGNGRHGRTLPRSRWGNRWDG
jgi:hypothetical protein